MKENKSLFSQLHKKAIFYGLVDEGGWFPQMLASRKNTAVYTKLAKISVFSVCSVAKIPSCLGVLVANLERNNQ